MHFNLHVHVQCTCVLMSQELNGRAEGKFNRLKAQAKTKIATLSKELEKLRQEHGVPQLDLSAQVSILIYIYVYTCTCTCTCACGTVHNIQCTIYYTLM